MNQSILLTLSICLLVVPTIAFGSAYNCTGFSGGLCATTTGLSNMSKTNIYAWGFSGITIPTGQVILSATIAFSGIYNWDTAQNRLDIDLLDTPNSATSGGSVSTAVVNSVSTDVPVSQWNDDFLHKNTVTTNGLGDYRYALTANGSSAYGMVAVGANNNTTDNPDHAAMNLGAVGTVDQTHSFNTTAKNYIYTLSATDLTALTNYITNGGNFAFGFNPDCHYYDSGVTMQITFAAAPVPEPGSILLFGTVGALVASRMRRTKRAQA